MIDREDAERMLNLAKVDLKAIRNMLDRELFEDSIFGFHAQQAVEKGLKSWLSLRRIGYSRTHDLRLLMSLLESQAQEDCTRFESLVDLTDFAVQLRYDYPVHEESLNRTSVAAQVQAFIDHVQSLLSGTDVGQ